jgi:phenylacetate-CoA ligase
MGILHTHFILPLTEPERHAGLPGRLRQIKKFDRMPERLQRKVQQDRLRKLLEHAYATVPFYRRRFDSAGFHPRQARVDHPMPLPVLTREDLRTASTWLVSSAFPAEKLRVALSGATDRMPTRFLRDIEGVRDKVALKMKLDEWAGFSAGDNAMMLWGAASDAANEFNWRWRAFEGVFMRQSSPPPGVVGIDFLEKWRWRYEKQRPKILCGRATVLAAFAAHLRERGVIHRPNAVISTAEVLSVPNRRLLATVFKSAPFNYYGRRDIGMIAAECSEHEGLHFHPWGSFVEFDPIAQSPDGPVYRLLVTDLLNYGQPFIRFDTGDCVTLTEQSCSCGRWFPLVGKILGRLENGAILANGTVVPNITFNDVQNSIKSPLKPVLALPAKRKRTVNRTRPRKSAMSA